MVDGDKYLERATSVVSQFEMVRKAVRALTESAQLTAVADKEVAHFLKFFRKVWKEADRLREERQHVVRNTSKSPASAGGIETNDRPMLDVVTADEGVVPEGGEANAIRSHAERTLENMRSEAKARHIKKVEDVLNRVNQNELILLVALFEMQMKDIHREILQQNRSLLNLDRQVPLGKIVAEGTEAVVQLEIEREVQSHDRKNCSERAAYFRQRLDLEWPDEVGPAVVGEVLELRNRLLHEDPDMSISADQLEEVKRVTLLLPINLCYACATKYPDGFHIWDGWITGEALKRPDWDKDDDDDDWEL